MNEEEKKNLINFISLIKRDGALKILQLLLEKKDLTFTIIKQTTGKADNQVAYILKGLFMMGLAKKESGYWVSGDMTKEVLSNLNELAMSLSNSCYQLELWMGKER